MNKPEMIIFDFGHTLLCQPDWDSERGNRELFRYITKNPDGVTVQDYQKAINEVFGQVEEVRASNNCDIAARVVYRVVNELLNVEFSLTLLEQEIVFWTAAASSAVMPYADKMLDYLNENEIRTAIISNTRWSGETLTERINRFLPNNRFEFIMASCDYMYRKPSRVLFDIALKKAGLPADRVWYCGDSLGNDVFGAHGAGIFPVHYDCEMTDAFTSDSENGIPVPDFEYLHIHDWRELIDILESVPIA